MSLQIIGKIAGVVSPLIFPGGRAVKLIKSGVRISESTNPCTVATNITLTVLDCCSPPPVRLATRCITAVGLLGVSIQAPNPVTLGSFIHIMNDIYETC